MLFVFFFFNDTATTEIYTLSLHDALPICLPRPIASMKDIGHASRMLGKQNIVRYLRSEEHTSELQSRLHLVCRLLLEKKKDVMLRPSRYRPAIRYAASLPRFPVTS